MNLFVAHSSDEKLRCSFYTVVVRNAALAENYPGGLKGFVDRYRAQSNNQITVICDMGCGFHDVVQDLTANSLQPNQDFALLDAGHLALSTSIDMGRYKRPKMMEIGINWLRVQYTPSGMFVWHEGKS